MKSIFTFTNYRLFLKDFYEWHKEYERGFSYREMARMVGFTSPNYLKLVIDGTRSLGRKSIKKVSDGLRLRKDESEYFSYLVFFAQAKNDIDRNYYLGLISSMRASTVETELKAEQFDYLSKWYIPVIRELLVGWSNDKDINELSKSLNCLVPAAEIVKTVSLLQRLGMITLDQNGNYQTESTVLNTSNELNSYAVRNYHRQILEKAQDALEKNPQESREINSLTLRLSANGFKRIKERLQKFRGELLQIAQDDHDTDMVFLAGLQLFPIATMPKNDKSGDPIE